MNKPLTWLTCAAVLITYTAHAQDKTAIKFSETINKDQAYKHLSVLASDEYEGRETGKPGAWKAADYIKNHFQQLGLKPPVNGSYFQDIGLFEVKPSTPVLTLNGQSKELFKDFFITSASIPDKGIDLKTEDIVFAGFGQTVDGYDDFSGLDVAGKVVMILGSETPQLKNGTAITPTRGGALGGARNPKIKYLIQHNAKAILFIDPIFKNMSSWYKENLLKGSLVLKTKENAAATGSKTPIIAISYDVADELLKKANLSIEGFKKQVSDSGKPASQTLKNTLAFNASKSETRVKAANVLGFLEGSDPKLKNEVLAITAHYDHIGLSDGPDKVNNGADDDGSGTTGVLMMAEAFVKAKKAGKGPKRSILFMTVVGEEKGLLGSEWYSENPVFPLANTVADLNIDMIGRVDPEHEKAPDYVYLIGSDRLSADLDAISKKANDTYIKMNLDYKYNDPKDPNHFYERSDHYNFAKHNIPIIFFFNGVHKDYHQPSDEIDKIDFPLLARRTQLVYYTAWDVANRKDRPALNAKK